VAQAGAVVAFWDGGGLQFAVSGGEEKQRIRLVLPGGREERVPAARIALVVEPSGLAPGKDPEAAAWQGGAREQWPSASPAGEAASGAGGLGPGGGQPTRRLGAWRSWLEDTGRRGPGWRWLRADALHFVRRGEIWGAGPRGSWPTWARSAGVRRAGRRGAPRPWRRCPPCARRP
jgi:hypothetical protein